jgi:SAM-dependent methyltransferase
MRSGTQEYIVELEENYWWYKARLFILEQVLLFLYPGISNLRILNAGAGTGIITRRFRRFGRVISLDLFDEALKLCKQNGSKNNVLADAQVLPFKSDTFDLAIGFDVMEHLGDDLAGIEEIKRVLRPGGKYFLSVPAYNFMWSLSDDIAHHRRRYTYSSFLSLLVNAGLVPKKISYFNTIFFPLAVIQRFLNKILKVQLKEDDFIPILPPLMNKIFTWVFSFEAYPLRWINFPYGLSILAIGEKS